MVIGDRLRELRKGRSLSQGDIEKRTGLLRCYISRVENGHVVPAIETLRKLAGALEVPLYQLFYDGVEPPKVPKSLEGKTIGETAWGSRGKPASYLGKLRKCLSRTAEPDRRLILVLSRKMVRRRHGRAALREGRGS